MGFSPEDGNHSGNHLLRIQNEYYERNSKMHKMSNIRTEINGIDLIQEYCRTNNLQKLLDMPSITNAVADKIRFTQKQAARNDNNDILKPVDFPDFGFRVSYQTETYHTSRIDTIRNIIRDWTNSKKTFRYLNRVRFVHPDIPIFADISIVKKSRTTNRHVPVPQYSIQDSQVLSNVETYEIELEVDNKRMQNIQLSTLMGHLRKSIRMVLGAIQETLFPIGFQEMNQVLRGYLPLITQDENEPITPEAIDAILARRDLSVFLPKYFVGPSSMTLQIDNINTIQQHYTVTDKADGERRLLYIAQNGRVYMITSNMNIIFTGIIAYPDPSKVDPNTKSKPKDDLFFHTLMDGEYIQYDKHGHVLKLYAAFDLYFIQGKSIRKEGFYPITLEDRNKGNFRLLYLEKVLDYLKFRSILESPSTDAPSNNIVGQLSKDRACGLEIRMKNFYVATAGSDKIFEACHTIMKNVKDNIFSYNTDGLIFTPALMGVGADRIGVAGRPKKETWEYSFKWKPPQYNTIDFLVTIKKDKRDQDEIKYMQLPGRNLQDDSKNIVPYKTLILKCGYDPKRHGYLNPYNDVLQDRNTESVQSGLDPDKADTYRPVPFQPTNPYDPNACFCNVVLQEDGKDGILLTEEKEYFEADMIVEFRYDASKEGAWKWIPLRVRYDKTAELRSGHRNYGNAYHTANSNWHSIHNPISEEMITTGEGIPTEPHTQNDVYYNRTTRESNSQGLRNFHNLYVKKRLIMGVSNPGHILIDLACGKAGDLSKWRNSQLKFVLGIDVNRDNITNQVDGACSRYLNDIKRYGKESMPRCIFIAGDSGKNIRKNGDAFNSEKERDYIRAIFAHTEKNPNTLPPAVFKNYGIGEQGFDITSIQFAIHYMFSDEITLHNLLRNVSDCTRIGGYFIGTTYDGATVFNLLRKKQKGESWTVMRNGKKLAEITKKYTTNDEDVFPEDEGCIGMQIDVYQDSINKVFPEFLVNFKYLIRLMDQYGFALLTNDEASKLGFKSGSGTFEDLYKSMMKEIKENRVAKDEYGTASDMSIEEKQISFLNRYFIFKKTHTVDTENLYKIIKNHAILPRKPDVPENVSELMSEDRKSGDTMVSSISTTIVKSKKLTQKVSIQCNKEDVLENENPEEIKIKIDRQVKQSVPVIIKPPKPIMIRVTKK